MTGGRMGFVGVDTAGSSIMRVFPLWAEELGLPSGELRGFDIPVDAPAEAYRAVVTAIRDDPEQAGALVTTHKMHVFDAANDLFDGFDSFALACREVSSVSKENGSLLGHAKDPITVGLSLESIIPTDYFATTDATVVCLGSGGSGTALSWYLAHRDDKPRSVVITGRRQETLDHTRLIHERGGLDTTIFDYRLVTSAEAADAVVAAAGDRAIVVNATGMGKDRPGSPLTDAVVFPQRSILWEFNYRGSLEFLAQARSREAADNLTVVDGWEYFIHGWSQAIAEVFHIPMDAARVERLAALATTVR